MQKTYRRRYAKAVAGMMEGTTGTPRVRSLTNAADSTYETWTVAVPATPANSTTYSIVADDFTASHTTDASATQAELSAGLLSAARLSGIYDIAVVTLNSSTHVLTLERKVGSTAMDVSVSGGSGGTVLTATKTIAAAISTVVPFGRFVGRQASDTAGTARLMDTTDDIPVGIALATHAGEKIQQADGTWIAGYRPDEVMDIVDRVNSNEGIWCECVETSGITEEDTVYVSVATGHKGKVTKSSVGTVATSRCSFRSEVEQDHNGNPIVLVSINKD